MKYDEFDLLVSALSSCAIEGNEIAIELLKLSPEELKKEAIKRGLLPKKEST